MNDYEEVRFGLIEGDRIFRSSPLLRDACGTHDRFDKLLMTYDHYYKTYAEDHVLDAYIFCLSEHPSDNYDGLLSMWRGYGGNGNGAALVFDTSRLQNRNGSPFILAKVVYATKEQRLSWINERIQQFCEILKSASVRDDMLWFPAYTFFERLKLFALFSKHQGFHEEREWRVVYMKERDGDNRLKDCLSYAVTSIGIVPKLRFKIEPIEGLTAPDFSLSKFIERIILGPSVSSPIAGTSFKRMLSALGQSELAPSVFASTIPFRA